MKTELLQKKQCYVTPEVTVVTFKAEHGFNGSLKVQSSSQQMGINEWNTFTSFENESQTDVRESGTALW